MTAFKTLDDVDVSGKRVLVRVDLNVPMADGKVTDATRILRILPTIGEISEKGGKVILLAHFGRPKGKPVEDMSLAPVVETLSDMTGKPVAFASDCIGEAAASCISKMHDGDIALLENTRFHPGEEKNDPDFARALAQNGDLFVADAFSASHRAHASTVGLSDHMETVCGRTMQAELEALEQALGNPRKPVGAVVGGAKVSTKLDLLDNLVEKLDVLIIGGGMANTFLVAQGASLGASLVENDLLDTARSIMQKAEAQNCRIVLPTDGAVATEFSAGAENRNLALDAQTQLADNEMVLDAGTSATQAVVSEFSRLKTLVWNGPLGAFEMEPFDRATVQAAQAAARLTREGDLVSIAGGGDTVAALNHADAAKDFTYVSTAGGAFLEWMEGKELPGVAILKR